VTLRPLIEFDEDVEPSKLVSDPPANGVDCRRFADVDHGGNR
jgi:hypothetical protein